MSISRPARRVISSRLRVSRLTVPAPTVPSPNKPTLTEFNDCLPCELAIVRPCPPQAAAPQSPSTLTIQLLCTTAPGARTHDKPPQGFECVIKTGAPSTTPEPLLRVARTTIPEYRRYFIAEYAGFRLEKPWQCLLVLCTPRQALLKAAQGKVIGRRIAVNARACGPPDLSLRSAINRPRSPAERLPRWQHETESGTGHRYASHPQLSAGRSNDQRRYLRLQPSRHAGNLDARLGAGDAGGADGRTPDRDSRARTGGHTARYGDPAALPGASAHQGSDYARRGAGDHGYGRRLPNLQCADGGGSPRRRSATASLVRAATRTPTRAAATTSTKHRFLRIAGALHRLA